MVDLFDNPYPSERHEQLHSASKNVCCTRPFKTLHTLRVRGVSFCVQDAISFGAPERSRTHDLLIRSQTLYPTELLAQDWYHQSTKPLASVVTQPFTF